MNRFAKALSGKTFLWASASLMTLVAVAPAHAQAAGCRTMANPDGGAPMTMCKDAQGRWVQAPAPAQVPSQSMAAMTPGFRGKIVYNGSYHGTGGNQSQAPRVSAFNLGGLVNAAIAGRNQKKEAAGSITFTLEFNGERVEGNYVSVGTLRSARVSGQVHDGICTLYDSDGGTPWTGRCDQSGFAGTARSLPSERYQADLTFDTRVQQVTDYAQQERDRAAAQVAAAAERKKQAAAAAAAIAAMPAAGKVLTTRLDGYVATDARGWAMNHYDAGSMHNVRIAEGTAASGSYTLRGEYTFNGGSSGWVLAKMAGGKLSCIQFWDAMAGCRALRAPGQGQAAMGALAAGLMSGGGGSSGSGGGCDNACQNARLSAFRNAHPGY